MKNYLLAGTSALALTFAAFGAQAQTAPGKFDIKISGDAYFEAGIVGANNDFDYTAGLANGETLTAGDFTNRFRLTINPEAKADNGLTYGALARLRANFGGSFNAPGAIDGDKAYVYVSGTFGEVRGGVTYGPSDVTYVGHPMDFQLQGSYDQWRSYTGKSARYAWGQYGTGAATATGTVASEGMQLLRSHNIDTKLVYYSPRFFGQTPTTGLQGAVSYTPHNGDNANGNVSINTAVARNDFLTVVNTNQTTSFNDVVELTANYVENWGPWMAKVSAGYNTGSSLPSSGAAAASKFDDLESFQFGAQVGYQNFVVGGGYVNGGTSGYAKNGTGILAAVNRTVSDQEAWNIGAQYTWGPIVAGVKFLEESDAGSVTVAGDRVLDALTFGVMYTVAPGLRVGLEDTIFWARNDAVAATAFTSTAAGATANYKQDGNVFLARTAVAF